MLINMSQIKNWYCLWLRRRICIWWHCRFYRLVDPRGFSQTLRRRWEGSSVLKLSCVHIHWFTYTCPVESCAGFWWYKFEVSNCLMQLSATINPMSGEDALGLRLLLCFVSWTERLLCLLRLAAIIRVCKTELVRVRNHIQSWIRYHLIYLHEGFWFRAGVTAVRCYCFWAER